MTNVWLRVLLPALLLFPSMGCEFLSRFKPKGQETLTPTGPVREVAADELVSYLNTQAMNLQSVQYPDVAIDVRSGGQHFTLGDSSLACAKPRNFLLSGGRGLIGEIVNIGSNDREFWMYSRLPEKTYLYCAHQDFERGTAQLPFPFDPDWALQALGMATYPTNIPYQVTTDQRLREHVLTYDSTTPQGDQVRKQLTLAADQTSGTAPQVKRLAVFDRLGRRIAGAEIKHVATLPSGTDPTGRPVFVQVPTEIVLDWPQQQFRLSMRMRNPKVNVPFGPVELQEMFTKPRIDGVQPINLARAEFVPGQSPRR